MPRYGCFELQTDCRKCGQPVPVNGPFRHVTCSSCFAEKYIDPDIITGIMNDFEEEYQGLDEKAGSGGTIMSGSGTYKYGSWRLKPRCPDCENPLEDTEPDRDGTVACGGCGRKFEVYPAPEWLTSEVPSAVQCISAGRESTGEKQNEIVDEDAPGPVVMSCPQCGGTLSISAASERILKCEYCKVDVYVPDQVWTRLHPVETTAEWFVIFDGKTAKQLQVTRRRRDDKEEKKALKGWRKRPLPKSGLSFKNIVIKLVFIFAAILVVTAIGLETGGSDPQKKWETLSGLAKIMIIGAATLIPVAFAFSGMISFRFGILGKCKRKMKDLAEANDWKFWGAENHTCMGYLDGTWKGKDFELDPGDEYAVEVDIDDSLFYLKTEPPGYPPENMVRFTTGDNRFDTIFPIRYGDYKTARKINESPEAYEKLLAPVNWFLDRWEAKLALMKIDWSSVGVHLAPGHKEQMGAYRYLEPDVIEPLLEDTVTLAKAIEAVHRGNEPELPDKEY